MSKISIKLNSRQQQILLLFLESPDIIKLNAKEGSILFIHVQGNDEREDMSAQLEFMASDKF